MDPLNTFEDVPVLDSIYVKQKEDVTKMRASLLSCSDDGVTSRKAIQQITALRIYHQLSRIIRYTEMCDKIEVKMYEAIDAAIERTNVANPTSWMQLMDMQDRLQNIMIRSQEMLKPYLDLTPYTNAIDLTTQSANASTVDTHGLDSRSREELRNRAQAVLVQLNIQNLSVTEVQNGS